MCRRLPILTVLSLVLAGLLPTDAPGQDGPSAIPPKSGKAAPVSGPTHQPAAAESGGSELLAKAIAAIDLRPSFAAKTSHQVSLFDTLPTLGTGRYLEQQSPQGRLFRLDLRVNHGGERSSTLVEVFDGHHLWSYTDRQGTKRLTKVDMDRVNKVLQDRKQLGPTDSIAMKPGLGGLSKLLRGLYATFDFKIVEQTEFLAGDESPQRELPAWKLLGTWRKEKLTRLYPEQADDLKAGKPVKLGELPPHLPDHVLLYLGKEDLFPYQIDYRRGAGQPLPADDPPEGRSILTMRFTEVDFGRRVDESEFHYRPGKDTPEGLTPVDGTSAFLARPGLKELLH